MSQLSFFGFDGKRFSVLSLESGAIWFRASGVCKFLGFTNTHLALKVHAPDMYREFSVGKGRPANYLSEPGFYRMVFASKAVDAIRFQNFVFEDVLPSIRKSGVYISPSITDVQAQAAIEKLNSILSKPDPWERLTDGATIDLIHRFYGQMCGESFWWKYIYHWLTEDERARLNALNPIDKATKQRKTRIYNWITTENEVRLRLKDRLSVVVNILLASSSRTAFEDNMQRHAGFDQIALFG